VADEFKKKHPDVTVKVEYPGFDLITKAKAAIGGGEGIADVYALLPSVFGVESFKNGLLVDLTPYYQKDSEWQSWTDLWSWIPPGNYRWPQTAEGAIYHRMSSDLPCGIGLICSRSWWVPGNRRCATSCGKIQNRLRLTCKGCPAGFARPHCDWLLLEAGTISRAICSLVCFGEKWSQHTEIARINLWKQLHDGKLFTPGVLQRITTRSEGLFKDRKVAMFTLLVRG
jgi:hypothetical protein